MNDRSHTARAAERPGGRRRLAGAFAALALACGAGEPEEHHARPDAAAAAAPRASVLLLTIDTLRADHLGAYGYPEPISPEIDALAERGVVFERAIAASSRTRLRAADPSIRADFQARLERYERTLATERAG
jgi:hypothetical protein